MASKRIVVLGAGYAGLPAAKRLANRMAPEPVEVTMVNAAPGFVERPRLHQMSTGPAIRPMSLRELLEPSGVRFRLGTVTVIDPLRRQVVVDEEARLICRRCREWPNTPTRLPIRVRRLGCVRVPKVLVVGGWSCVVVG